MVAVNSSSNRKSSSANKKKSNKISSEVKRRRSRRKNTSKKLHRRDTSVSFSDDDSRSRDSISISSSDLEDNYHRSRRARSRTRRDEKGSRKRVRRRSTSREDSRDSPHRRKKKVSKGRVRSRDSKKKGSNRKDVFLLRKKTHKKKRSDIRSQRDKSVDSVSSDSRSYSTCKKGRGSSCNDMKFERLRGRSEERERKAKKSSGKTSNERQNCRNISRSCSSFSDHSNESSYCSEEIFSRENYSRRRIKSVLAKESNEAEGIDNHKEENRAEIIQYYDDYPSSRSDSYEGGRKKDTSHHAHVQKKRKIVDKVEEAFISSTRPTAFTKSNNEDPKKYEASTGIDSLEGNDLESVLRQKALEKFEASTGIDNSEGNDVESFLRQKALEKFEASNGNDGLEGNDLESILRQKALENLKKFRGGLRMNLKALGVQSHRSDDGVEQPSTAKADTTGTEFHKEAIRVAGSQVVSQDMKNVGMPSMERKPATSKDDGLILDKNQNQHESMAKPNVARIVLAAGDSSSGEMVAGKATEKNSTNVGIITNKVTQDTSDPSTVNQTPTTQKSPTTKPIEPENIVERNIIGKNVDEIPKTANGCSNVHVSEISKVCESAAEASSCVTPVSGEHKSNEQGGVAKGSSQFEQKTMSVMRGGEMVQVSYKVYIPQKLPALARRKLQR